MALNAAFLEAVYGKRIPAGVRVAAPRPVQLADPGPERRCVPIDSDGFASKLAECKVCPHFIGGACELIARLFGATACGCDSKGVVWWISNGYACLDGRFDGKQYRE